MISAEDHKTKSVDQSQISSIWLAEMVTSFMILGPDNDFILIYFKPKWKLGKNNMGNLYYINDARECSYLEEVNR
jgi:hypothetical protein